MPLFALALNITWEFIFSFVVRSRLSLQVAINVTWFFFDLVILYTYLRYGRKEFPGTVKRLNRAANSWGADLRGFPTRPSRYATHPYLSVRYSLSSSFWIVWMALSQCPE